MTLVLLTPVGLDARMWDVVGLGGTEAVRHEWPGFGARPRAPAPPDMAALADEVAASHPGPLDVVGCSMGGMVGQHLAIRHPDRVRSLLVACTGAAAVASVLDRARAAEETGMEGVLRSTLERWFTPEALARRPEPPGVAYARETLLSLDPRAFADGWRAIATHDARPRLSQITARTTCVAGRQDVSAPVARVREVADGIPGARLVVVDGPHMLPLERPEAFRDLVRRHLAGAVWENGAVPEVEEEERT